MGLWTVQASKHFDYVYSFEPNPEVYRILLKNIEINHVQNLTLENVAIASFDGELTLHQYYNHAWSSVLTEHNNRKALDNSWQVQCKKLDSVLLKAIVPTVVKIDTEGYELNVLKGAERILSLNHPKLLIEVHSWNDYKEITDYLSGFDYKITQPEPLHLVGE
jgi:FkbM family methyltransferase